MKSLSERVLAGEVRAASRLMRLIDDGDPAATAELRALFPHTGKAYVIGITGSPGAGKSTLTDRLIAHYRKAGKRVGVLAVDPTSPFTGGAILGDRIRMQVHATDPNVFIRSLATRGNLGGLSRATGDCLRVMDAMGLDVILVETVGVGQDEIDIAQLAHTTIVVLVPGMGDDIQAIKAGIMEIADVFIVNKADRQGADQTVAAIEAMLALQGFVDGAWRPPVIRTEATAGRGVAEVWEAVERFRAHSAHRQGERRRDRAEFRLREVLGRGFLRHVEEVVLAPGELATLLARIAARELDPYSAAESVMRRALGRG